MRTVRIWDKNEGENNNNQRTKMLNISPFIIFRTSGGIILLVAGFPSQLHSRSHGGNLQGSTSRVCSVYMMLAPCRVVHMRFQGETLARVQQRKPNSHKYTKLYTFERIYGDRLKKYCMYNAIAAMYLLCVAAHQTYAYTTCYNARCTFLFSRLEPVTSQTL